MRKAYWHNGANKFYGAVYFITCHIKDLFRFDCKYTTGADGVCSR